ncbi:MAG: hypothetical protein FIA97_18185 [Methylococcaceae bacterium]|nr:hypothetical protein [Methylococcaceae bacterium]
MQDFDDALRKFLAGNGDFVDLRAAASASAATDEGRESALWALQRENATGALSTSDYAGLLACIDIPSQNAIGGEPAIAPSSEVPVTRFGDARNPAEPDALPDASAPVAGDSEPSVGSVLRHRFVLEEVLGAGGMGTVFKALDLRKVEANDRQAHVAIKLLNPDFRSNPLALMALQRETKRTQGLSHPNIVAVYDFDRDGPHIFMSMECLEGKPLSRFIRDLPEGGAPFDQVWPVIESMGQALAYAHRKGVVHSDFKPSNVLIDQGGEVKVLDFGIACAVGRVEGNAPEPTVFNARDLGALTPAYASLEQLYALPPDPRDDIYALACVTYELLAGKHPFGRRPASQARDMGLAPKPIKGLRAAQWRGLKQALAFQRNERTPDVATFLDALRPRSGWYRLLASLTPLVWDGSPKAVVPDAFPPGGALDQEGQRSGAIPSAQDFAAQESSKLDTGSSLPHLRPEARVAQGARYGGKPRSRRRSVEDRWRRSLWFGAAGLLVTFGVYWHFSAPQRPIGKPAPGSEVAEPSRSGAITFTVEPTPHPDATSVQGKSPGEIFRDCPLCPEMVVIPAGSFVMGSPASEKLRNRDESPQHPIDVRRFAFGRNEVTRGQFATFAEATGHVADAPCQVMDGKWKSRSGTDWQRPGFEQGDEHPAVCVSWRDALAYTAWLSGVTGQHYRLPTEAEWEYAARAGTTSMRYWGDGEKNACDFANVADQTQKKAHWSGGQFFPCNDSHEYTAPVGQYRVNGFGLNDMLGNVWEWTCSAYTETGYDGNELRCAAAEASRLVVRGGSWNYGQPYVRSADRDWDEPTGRSYDQGFRVVRE